MMLQYTDWMGDITVTNSHVVSESLVMRRIVPAVRIRVIPNALPPAERAPNAQERLEKRRGLGLGQGDFVWLAVGRLEDAKDYPNMLQAFALLQGFTIGAGLEQVNRLIIAGEGRLRSELQSLSQALQVSDHVRFLGLRDDVPGLLAVADAFVLSSSSEGLPNALMEALLAGKPVVSTRVGGTPELMVGDESHLVPPRAPERLARAMLEIMSLSPEARALLGEKGRARVLGSFVAEKVVDMWQRLFSEILAWKRGSSCNSQS
jgi:glycosyltransferase involved in cell wall biosynthesis